jgi:peptide/nickel transport system permease protein
VWPTVLLIGTSTIASILLGIWVGIAQGWRWGSRFDRSMLGITLVLYSMPEFWFGLLMIMLFSVTWSIFPSGGMQSPASGLTGLAHIADILNHLALPFFVLTVSYLAEYSLIMRSSLMEVLGEDFILVARAKGVRERMVRRRHAVPNALLPTMTVTILSLGYVLGGAIVIETIFSWPGLGRLTYLAIGNQDFALLQGVFLLFSAAVIVSNLVADLLYSYLDPRVRAA